MDADIGLTTQTVTCPNGHQQMIRLPTRLEVFGGPDARTAFFEGHLGQYSCPVCHCSFRLEQELAYLDPVRRQFFLVEPHSRLRRWAELERLVPSMLQSTLELEGASQPVLSEEPMLARLVFGLDSLCEKLLLWEAGLDDRLVEIGKLDLIGHHKRSLAAPGLIDLTLAHIDPSWSELQLEARRPGGSSHTKPIALPLKRYRDLMARQSELEARLPELFSRPFVSAIRYLMPGSTRPG